MEVSKTLTNIAKLPIEVAAGVLYIAERIGSPPETISISSGSETEKLQKLKARREHLALYAGEHAVRAFAMVGNLCHTNDPQLNFYRARYTALILENLGITSRDKPTYIKPFIPPFTERMDAEYTRVIHPEDEYMESARLLGDALKKDLEIKPYIDLKPATMSIDDPLPGLEELIEDAEVSYPPGEDLRIIAITEENPAARAFDGLGHPRMSRIGVARLERVGYLPGRMVWGPEIPKF